MAKKRGNGEGSISKYGDGRWCGRYTIRTSSGVKRKAIYGKTRAEVAKKLAEAMGDASRGIVFDSRGVRVGGFLERWLEDVVRPNKAHRTYTSHVQQVRAYIIPSLGSMRLEALRKADIDRLYSNLLTEKPEGSGLATSTVRRVHAVLHAALEEAVRGDLLPRNPAAHANKPKVRQEERVPLTREQARTFLQSARGDRFEALYVLCLMVGLREGEALGLRWSDIDLEAQTLRVDRQLQRRRRVGDTPGRLVFTEPKNASRRLVGLPHYAVNALNELEVRQSDLKRLIGDLYEDQDLVFATEAGRPVDAQNVVNRYFKPLLKKAGLPPVSFHDLRHSCLSLLAQSGEPIRDLQALAGHATAAFTLQRYTHHYETSAKRTAKAMSNIIFVDS